MRNETQYIKITMNAGFNRLRTQYGNVSDKEQLALKVSNGRYVDLGTYEQAKERAVGTTSVIGMNGDIYGEFGTQETDDNLFVAGPISHSETEHSHLKTLRPPLPPRTGGNIKRRRSRSKKLRSRRSRSKKSRCR